MPTLKLSSLKMPAWTKERAREIMLKVGEKMKAGGFAEDEWKEALANLTTLMTNTSAARHFDMKFMKTVL